MKCIVKLVMNKKGAQDENWNPDDELITDNQQYLESSK